MPIPLFASSAARFLPAAIGRASGQQMCWNVQINFLYRKPLATSIGMPLATSQAIAINTFLTDWESVGLDDAGLPAWQKYASQIKKKTKSASVFWVSGETGKYFSETGLNRTSVWSACSSSTRTPRRWRRRPERYAPRRRRLRAARQ